MNKVIKKFNNGCLTYKIGYDLLDNKIYPSLEIYKNNKLLSGCDYYDVNYANSSEFFTVYSDLNTDRDVGTMEDMFIVLRKYNEIPDEVEREYENIFIMYKLNNFKKI
jgi:hypothetical protein